MKHDEKTEGGWVLVDKDIVRTNKCDVWQFFGGAESKGKKNNHVFHNGSLDHIVKHYRDHQDVLSPLEIVVHTDGAPTQYKNRFTWLKMANFSERHPGCSVTHCVSIKYRFKGEWDREGKTTKHALNSGELKGERSRKAFDAYVYASRNLTRTEPNKKWSRYKGWGDIRIQEKTTNTMDTRRFRYVVYNKEDFDRLNQGEHEEKIVQIDLDNAPDPGVKAFPQSMKIFQVRGNNLPLPNKNDNGHPTYPMELAELPCGCPVCRGSEPFPLICPYAQDRSIRHLEVQQKTPAPQQ